MALQFITTPAGDRMVVMSEEEYKKLSEALERAENAADIVAVERFKERMARGEEELIPAEVVKRMIDGESKIKVWREYRKMSLRDLAATVGISPAIYLKSRPAGATEPLTP